MSSEDVHVPEKSRKTTATQFFLRGLAISLPPVLTLLILLWIAQGIYGYVINPISTVVQYTIAQFIDASVPKADLVRLRGLPELEYCGRDYLITQELREELVQRIEAERRRTGGQTTAEATGGVTAPFTIPEEWIDLDGVYVPFGDRAVPYRDYLVVAQRVRPADMPRTAIGVYMGVVTHRHFQGLFHISAVAVILCVVVIYFLGRFVTVRIGAWMVAKVETLVLGRLPLISNIYGSVKQVTEFVFAERQIEYNRVVAVEYPRRGIWSLGFVTGDSLLELTATVGEPMVSVIVPSSPMPVTGYTINVPRSAIRDLDMTVDQAFQFCISCGVLVPPQQQVTPELLKRELARRLTGETAQPPYVRESGEKPSANADSDAAPSAPLASDEDRT